MAQITISTTEEEQEKVLKAIEETNGAVTPVSSLASLAGLSQSRTRYVIMDLLDQDRIVRTPHKNFNKHYCRYSYTVKK